MGGTRSRGNENDENAEPGKRRRSAFLPFRLDLSCIYASYVSIILYPRGMLDRAETNVSRTGEQTPRTSNSFACFKPKLGYGLCALSLLVLGSDARGNAASEHSKVLPWPGSSTAFETTRCTAGSERLCQLPVVDYDESGESSTRAVLQQPRSASVPKQRLYQKTKPRGRKSAPLLQPNFGYERASWADMHVDVLMAVASKLAPGGVGAMRLVRAHFSSSHSESRCTSPSIPRNHASNDGSHEASCNCRLAGPGRGRQMLA